ncbi:MAG: hypothetical protein GAK37_01292 [Pseudomonas sp.]|nr:MAG: hypothetical protein GAK37_01292 [Pseudomonas sp.]
MDLYFFNSSKHPQKTGELGHYAKRVERLLDEYKHLARGKINLHLIDPTPFSEEEYKARLFGLEGEQGFFGLIGIAAGHEAQRIESFNLDHEPLLEYEISRLLHKVAHPQQPVIGLLSALPMDGEQDKKGQTIAPPWQWVQTLRRHFNLMTLTPHTGQIPAHVKTLVLVDPGKLPERTLYAVDQFVLGGGTLLMFLDPQTEPGAPSRLEALLAAWGVQMPAKKVLADATYASSAILAQGQPAVRHPGALTLPRQAMARHDVSTLKLRTVTVLNSGALFALKKSRTTLTPLLQSSGQAVLVDAERLAEPDRFDALINEITSRGQPHTIAARIEGPAYSAFPDGISATHQGLQKAAQIHVVVVADTALLDDRLWAATQKNGAPFSDNATFVLNILDNLAAPEALASIRPRTHANRPSGRLQSLRDEAERTYREKTAELAQRLDHTEREWQRLNPRLETVTNNALLQALNKERLRLPMEINAVRLHAYAQVRTLELQVKVLNLVPLPLLLSLIAVGIGLARQRRRARRISLY